MTQTNFEAQRRYEKRFLDAGYRRHTFYLSPVVTRFLEENRLAGETLGAVIERLLCPESAAARPACSDGPTAEERQKAREWRRRIRQAQNAIGHSRQTLNSTGRVLLSITLYREADRKAGGVVVTSSGIHEFKGESPETPPRQT